MGFDEQVAQLPAVRWKALNLQKLRDENPDKFKAEAQRLRTFLD